MAQNSAFGKNGVAISPEIQHMAMKNELGALCKIYTVPEQNTVPFGVGILCIVFSCGIVPFIFFANPPPSGFSIAGVTFLLVGCLMILLSRMYPRWHVYLWQYGFLSEKGRIRQVVRWDHIESLQSQVNAQHFIRCKISCQDGYKITVSSAFPEIQEFMDSVFEAFAQQCASQDLIIAPPKTIRAFTDIKLDRKGISNGQETLPWHEIQEFLIKDGKILLRKTEE
jgi:hypothetical protein